MVMKKITFSADPEKLELARRIAESKGTTLEEEVRQWLKDYGAGRWKSPKQPERDEQGPKSRKK